MMKFWSFLSIVFLSLNSIAQVSGTGQISGIDDTDRLNTITTAVPFLLIAPDARGGGLGDAGAATSPDANSIHWNPAKLAFIDKNIGFSMSYVPWLRALVPDINLAYLSGYKKISKREAIGASLRYFSLGDITFTDVVGNTTGQFRPNEFAVDVAYSRKLSDEFSGGLALRYIYSNLTGGINVQGQNTKAGQAAAADVGFYYTKKQIKLGEKEGKYAAGVVFSNIGSRISYSDAAVKNYLPMNLRLGNALTVLLDDYNSIAFVADFNKLLVPSPPIYELDNNGSPKLAADGTYVIAAGKDPNRPVGEAIFSSFNDAPLGASEELKEVNYSVGMEYWYEKLFAIRTGMFYEDPTKGNRKYVTLGAGLRYNVFSLDFTYLIPITQNHPLKNTLRFTLLFDFDAFKAQNKEATADPTK